MRLGLSQASYRWVAYPGLRIDQPEYGFRGMPFPYGSTTGGPREFDDNIGWWLDRCAEWDLEVLYLAMSWFKDEAAVVANAREMARRGIDWIGSVSGAWAVPEEEWPECRAEARRKLELAAAAGMKTTVIVNADPPGAEGQPVPNGGLRFGHFSREIAIDQQIENMIRNLGEFVAVAEECGVRLAYENHMDYRISELVEVVVGVDSPWLGICYDFANSYSVVEDQLQAAHRAAPYTLVTHVKDMRVQSITTTGEPRFFLTPIGYGDVEVAEIFEVLQQGAPDADNLPNCASPPCLPEFDPQLWMKLSVEWLGANCAGYFPRRFRTAA
ncbi:MAG: sugar phosphate isomerase/epimerase family protein [Chloroflexota bacterium]|jgi:sugar phosphate isomerase/epimerase|nr:sugar phosphate isomerase/epimerase family protein [Chloroflexota bacterium]